MVNIDIRIAEHEESYQKLLEKYTKLQTKMKHIENKIQFHQIAIQNLITKRDKNKETVSYA